MNTPILMTQLTLPVNMDTPGILITSCSNTYSPYTLVKDILNVETLPEGKPVIENVQCFDWTIETKYYTAKVTLCVTAERTIGNQHFAENIQAFVTCFDSEKASSLEAVKLWLPYLDQLEPEVKILVCERCSETTDVSKLAAQTWCIEHGFELVELNPETHIDSDTEDDFMETTGLKRIIQALHAHTWPNLLMKDTRHTVSPFIRQLMKEEHDLQQLNTELSVDPDCGENSCGDCEQTEEIAETSKCTCSSDIKNCDRHTDIGAVHMDLKDTVKEASSSRTDVCNGDTSEHGTKQCTEASDSLLPSEDLELFAALGNEDPGEESFEKLFEKFAHMKEKASNLPFEERRKYAEHVAISFWKAMGGDEDEIGDLDSD
ncbi:alpha- and gamma-adaptin-binding protein p34-like isoform X2 [Dreissena polymorpha]|uniref:alpha- and gamma-adaptin-binding protein p34-like isoform X2 n=1 Tax=Dreissena polymorpha TaxID=45954 RepID=UPI002263FC89|nr:alpha- and gamma-adaptin-binding protein p34-like isoform X2 [Dreissena polymorpha]